VGAVQAMTGSADPATERLTEMEHLAEMLGHNRRRMREAISAMETRLERFSPQPPVPQNAVLGGPAAEPQPGTLSFLRCMVETTAQEVGRLEAISSRLRELL
jgi:hypothetical protein